jgi:serine/threonine protein kinase
LAKRFDPVAADVRRLTSKSEIEQSLLTSAATEITVTGQVLGSPNYMPPEQAASGRGKVSRRSDVYALGAMLYHLTTGRPPFVAQTPTETLQQVLEAEPVSPRLLNPGVPRDLETIALKCMEKNPARRYPTAQALADELSRFVHDEAIQARPVNAAEKLWRWCRRRPVIASLIVLVHLIGAIGLAGICGNGIVPVNALAETISENERKPISSAPARLLTACHRVADSWPSNRA